MWKLYPKGKKQTNKYDFSMECGRSEYTRDWQAALSFRGPLDFRSFECDHLELAEIPVVVGKQSWFLPFHVNLIMGFCEEHM